MFQPRQLKNFSFIDKTNLSINIIGKTKSYLGLVEKIKKEITLRGDYSGNDHNRKNTGGSCR